jgi:hypothetical protein
VFWGNLDAEHAGLAEHVYAEELDNTLRGEQPR